MERAIGGVNGSHANHTITNLNIFLQLSSYEETGHGQTVEEFYSNLEVIKHKPYKWFQ